MKTVWDGKLYQHIQSRWLEGTCIFASLNINKETQLEAETSYFEECANVLFVEVGLF